MVHLDTPKITASFVWASYAVIHQVYDLCFGGYQMVPSILRRSSLQSILGALLIKLLIKGLT